ncbi:MAG: hypothetical protein ABS46_04145 [Cytophagaceae bacterium SCN 52-12]|nr:MAG: hypothetical protein ABS46_04145 [Cytophagaceae bacterium SCN 52-12]
MKPFDHRQELIIIFRKYLDGTATPEEKQFVEAWYGSFEKEPGILDNYPETGQELLEARMEQALRIHIDNDRPRSTWKTITRNIRLGRVAAAAVLILSLAGSWYYFTNTGLREPAQTAMAAGPDLAPGGNRAVLTLSNGKQIVLDSVSTGMLARQGNTVIHKVEDGLVSYTGEGPRAGQDFNTITAPAGGKYSVVLPDGSRVWLNAESSITFPTAFSPEERSVKISGEVYFEIAKDARRPFSVQVGALQKVRVLGTHFNINAYRDEGNITTTLLEGSVEVLASGDARPVMLKPGEQAALSGSGRINVRGDINTEEIVAWKNGMFQFEKADIETVMRQFSRWYNVDVIYEGPLPSKTFSGKIDRKVNASEALDILSFTGLNFRIEALPAGSKKGKIVILP